MRLSDEKITHLSHVILSGIMQEGLIVLKEDEGMLRKSMKRAITAELKIGQDMDDAVTRKIESLSKHVPEGSPEWEVLYKKYYEQEEIRRGRG